MGSSAHIIDCVVVVVGGATVCKRVELEHLWMIKVVVTDDDLFSLRLLFFTQLKFIFFLCFECVYLFFFRKSFS